MGGVNTVTPSHFFWSGINNQKKHLTKWYFFAHAQQHTHSVRRIHPQIIEQRLSDIMYNVLILLVSTNFAAKAEKKLL